MAPANNISPAGGRCTSFPPVRPAAYLTYMDVQTCKDHSIDKGEGRGKWLFVRVDSFEGGVNGVTLLSIRRKR